MTKFMSQSSHIAKASIKVGHDSGLSDAMETTAKCTTSFSFPRFHIQPVLIISILSEIPQFYTKSVKVFHHEIHGFLIGEMKLTLPHGSK